jgi:hypothetical protein
LTRFGKYHETWVEEVDFDSIYSKEALGLPDTLGTGGFSWVLGLSVYITILNNVSSS